MSKKEEVKKPAAKKDIKKELDKLDKELEAHVKYFETSSDFEDENKALILKVFLSATRNKLKSHIENI